MIATLVHERVLEVNYSCTPFNKFGDGPTEEISVSVLCKYKYWDFYFFWHCSMYTNLCLTPVLRHRSTDRKDIQVNSSINPTYLFNNT